MIFLVLAFQVVPTGTCLPCGGSTEFNCSTTFPINLNGILRDIPGGQMWMILTPDGRNIILSSNNRSRIPPDFEFIRPHPHEYTGIRVMNTNSSWNGTTLQCIAFSTTNSQRINTSAPAVTMEVGGEQWQIYNFEKGGSSICILGVKWLKLDDLLLNLFVVFEARRIKSMTPLQAAEAAKQLIIRARHGKISTLILIAYRHP